MVNLRSLVSAAMICGGATVLAGCQPQATGKTFPAPQAAPPVQQQIQNVANDPHIPAAQKASIEAAIAHGNGIKTERTPGQ